MTTYFLTAYDRNTGFLAKEYPIPEATLHNAKNLAHVEEISDPDAVGSYPLLFRQANAIATLAGINIEHGYDYYFEPFSDR